MDQKLHADCEHLYEHIQLPAHNIVLFIPTLPLLSDPSSSTSTLFSDPTLWSQFINTEQKNEKNYTELSEGSEKLEEDLNVGQTAFLAGSHILNVAKEVDIDIYVYIITKLGLSGLLFWQEVIF